LLKKEIDDRWSEKTEYGETSTICHSFRASKRRRHSTKFLNAINDNIERERHYEYLDVTNKIKKQQSFRYELEIDSKHISMLKKKTVQKKAQK